MRICKICSATMYGVMSFSKDKREKFDRCKKCYAETKHQNIKDSELDFSEILHSEYKKAGKQNGEKL